MKNLSDDSLPGYLMEWPRRRGGDAIGKFACLYKKQQELLVENGFEKWVSFPTQPSTIHTL